MRRGAVNFTYSGTFDPTDWLGAGVWAEQSTEESDAALKNTIIWFWMEQRNDETLLEEYLQ